MIIAILCRAALGLAALFAWPLARLVPRYRAVAAVLTAAWALDLARGALRVLVLRGNASPPAWAVVSYQGMTLAFPALSVALAVAVFSGARLGDVLSTLGMVMGVGMMAAWGGPAMNDLSGAPWLSLVGHAHAFSVAAQIAAVACLGAPMWKTARATWLDKFRVWMVLGWVIGVPERACLVLLAGDVAALFGPWLGAPVAHWSIWQAQGAICYGALGALELKWAHARSTR